MSPEVGVVDESAFDALLDDSPDSALSLLADMVGASDRELRNTAGRLAARIMCEVATTGRSSSAGIGRIESRRLGTIDGDIDLDTSTDGLAEFRASGVLDPDKWRVRGWGKPKTAICLLIDRSGSMTGERLAQAAVLAASVVTSVSEQRFFDEDDLSVLAFSKDVIAVRSAERPRHPGGVVEDLLRLRGHGITDLDAALRSAAQMLERSTARRKITLLLSDCRSTTGPAPGPSAGALDELCIIAPADDTADAEDLARRCGAQWTALGGVLDGPAAISRLLNP